MPDVARINDTISHGGQITGGSTTVLTNGRRTARLGDPVMCVQHGAQSISSASTTVRANGLGVARVGDSITCGATITSGSANTRAGG